MRKSWIIYPMVVMALLVGLYFSFGFLQTEFGYSVMSISNAKFLTGATDLNGYDAYLVDVIVNKGGEQIEGTITKEMLAQYGITNMPEGDFKVYLNLLNVSCDYQINWDSTTIYKIYQATVKGANVDSPTGCPWNGIDLNSVKSACAGTWAAARGTETASPGAPVAGGACNSIVDIQTSSIRPELGMEASEWCYAQLADITGGQVHWRTTHIGGIPWFVGYTIDDIPTASYKVEVILENSKGNRTSAILDNKVGTAMLSDIAKVKIVGSLIAQQYCGQPSIEKAIVKDLNTNTMKVIDRDFYNDYKSDSFKLTNYDNNEFAFQYNAPVPPRDPGVGAGTLFAYMGNLNRLFTNIYASEIKDNCQINGMVYSCKPDQDIVYPELQMIIKASWIGIREATGDAKIRSVKIPSDLLEGENTFITVEVENIGTTTDGFDVSLVCNKEVSLGAVRDSIRQGETESFYVNLNGVAGNYNCTVYARTASDPSRFDKRAISFTIKEQDIPKPTTCEKIPTQPCGRALWQAYPICSWNTQFCEEESKTTNWMLYAIIAAGVLIVLSLIYFIFKSKRK